MTTQLNHEVENWDELISENSPDFKSSGLKTSSLIRIGKLATVEAHIIEGVLGEIGDDRLKNIYSKLSGYFIKS